MKPLLLALTLLVAAPAWAFKPATPAADYRPGELIVRYRASADAVSAQAMKSMRGLTPKRALLQGRAELLALPSITDVPSALALLRGDPSVLYAEPNYLRHPRAFTPNDPLFGEQWGILNSGQANFISGGPAGNAGGDLHLIGAWDRDGDGVPDRTGTGTGAVTVAIVDDGFELSHEDLAANFIAGYDFEDKDSDPSPNSSSDSHGTSVAGAIGAIGNNGKGVAGAIWHVKLMPLKFGFDTASEIEALEYARTHGAQIVNASFGGPSYSQAESDEIQQLADAGILFVAAAGNEDSNTDFAGAFYPANYRLPNILAVAATNRQDDIASFSCYGPTTVDVAAPGLQIVTTTVGNAYTSNPGVSGTSFAAPYTAGIAALLQDYLPGIDYREMRARLIESADSGVDPGLPVVAQVSGGRVDAAQALALAARPALVIMPVQTSHYGNPAVPVYRPVVVADGNSGVLTPGTNSSVRVTVQNLWQSAAAITGTLSANGGGVSVSSGAQAFGNLDQGETATADFAISVAAGRGHHTVDFSLALSANGGAYTTTRHFSLEVAALTEGSSVTQAIGASLYDEFQTWVFQVPSNTAQVSFVTTASNDIDILVSQGAPAQYDITLGATDDDKDAVFFSNVPDAQVGGAKDGNERVTIDHPSAGAYFVTVIDFDRASNASYTLQASTLSSSSGGGGGSFDPVLALGLLVLVWGRLGSAGGLREGLLAAGWRRRHIKRRVGLQPRRPSTLMPF